MPYWNGHLSTGGWILSIVWTVLIVAALVSAIVFLVGAITNRRSPTVKPSLIGNATAQRA